MDVVNRRGTDTGFGKYVFSAVPVGLTVASMVGVFIVSYTKMDVTVRAQAEKILELKKRVIAHGPRLNDLERVQSTISERLLSISRSQEKNVARSSEDRRDILDQLKILTQQMMLKESK